MEKFAALLSKSVSLGNCFALHGEMGVGKSTFARAFIRAYCDDAEMEVPSPSFAILQNYGENFELFHYDLWRLDEGSSLEELDWEEAEKNIMLVEWPEHAGEDLPASTIHFFFSLEDGEDVESPRVLRWQAPEAVAEKLLQIKENLISQRAETSERYVAD
ncbi:tRNA (adenosine(37)-N6)-threonylcarbamoyltransferase complex ATPase subunit type 1 TsaE [Acetobacteraceae bacterium]|nr:tRNA (adenosine(37)-N6)-threonylcarbamoyltransferase complex ATPase subunit type 1 TsaE [Acetobacteraceae bacterium]